MSDKKKLIEMLADALWLQSKGSRNYVGPLDPLGSIMLDGDFNLNELVDNLLAKGVRAE